MRKRTPPIASLKKTLAMLEAVIVDGGEANVSALARRLGLPIATAHRQITTLASEGYLRRVGHGRHVAGPKLLGLLNQLDEKQVMANVAAPLLNRLASDACSIVQFGTLENDMVTYRIKIGTGADGLFTKVGMQLEAYCSGIGKVLLAHLPDDQLHRYLAGGPFVALTERTITDPRQLEHELSVVRSQGFALDDGEIADGLTCLAVPLRSIRGEVLAALSVSHAVTDRRRIDSERLLSMLQETAKEIEAAAFR